MNTTRFETTATIENGELKLSAPLPHEMSGRVRVVVTVPTGEAPQIDSSDLTDGEWLQWSSALSAADYADDPEEDIYTRQHGEPFDASQY